jgi:hypothetical protein
MYLGGTLGKVLQNQWIIEMMAMALGETCWNNEGG